MDTAAQDEEFSDDDDDASMPISEDLGEDSDPGFDPITFSQPHGLPPSRFQRNLQIISVRRAWGESMFYFMYTFERDARARTTYLAPWRTHITRATRVDAKVRV